MIEYKNITLQIRGQVLLKNAELDIPKGDKVVIRGPSGCGKSSILKCAVGALPLDAGAVRIDRIEVTSITIADIRSRIAFIGQEPILGTDRVRDALLLPFTYKAHRHNCPAETEIAEQLRRLHLDTDILDKPCSYISGGEKQRIAIARALLLKKTIFLADEITSALDPESKDAVMEQLFRPEITLLSASHDPDWIDRCDRVVLVEDLELHETLAYLDEKTGGAQ